MRRLPERNGVLAGAEAARIRRRCLSYADFVDAALFDPRWGYYSRGAVRFGEGGHYDTYPLAISPYFGRMVAQYAYRFWRRRGAPARFEICELGAGNGQLCLDVVLWMLERARHERGWKRFAAATRYRIIERSAALIARQQRQLGPLAETVRWTRGDPARSIPRGTPFGTHGVIVANEVLDCLPQHKLVVPAGGAPGVSYVVPELGGRTVAPGRLGAALARSRRRVRFGERLVPLAQLPRLRDFVRRYHPDLLAPRRTRRVSFVCPGAATLLHNAARFYRGAEALWIDYGDRGDRLARSSERRRVFAGPPRSGAGVFDDPGRDDITFMVDFDAAAQAARDAGWTVAFLGPQAELARRSGVALDAVATEQILRHRALTWMLAMMGVHPEQDWRRGAMTWQRGAGRGRVAVRRYVRQSVREFLDQRRSPFKLLITRR